MTHVERATTNKSSDTKITEGDVDRVVEVIVNTHPELAATGQAPALKRALESTLGEFATRPKTAHALTRLATVLSGSAAVGLIAAAAAPELPIISAAAAAAGLIAGWIVDAKSKHTTD
jgi:hypothetical protein